MRNMINEENVEEEVMEELEVTEKSLKDMNKEFSEDETRFDNQFEVLSDLPKPKSSIKKNITSDYIYAKLGQAERDFISENYRNAEFAKELIARYATTRCLPKWDSKNKDYFKNNDGSIRYFSIEELDNKKSNIIKNNANRIFEFFMIQPHMMAVLNRNRDDNFMVKLLGKYQEDEGEKMAQYTVDDRSILQKIKDKMSGQEVEYED